MVEAELNMIEATEHALAHAAFNMVSHILFLDALSSWFSY